MKNNYLILVLCIVFAIIFLPIGMIYSYCNYYITNWFDAKEEKEYEDRSYNSYLKNCSFLGITPKDRSDFTMNDHYEINFKIHGEPKTLIAQNM